MTPAERKQLDANTRLLRWLIVLLVFQIVISLADLVTGADRIATPHDAVVMAMEDLATMPFEERPFQLYVWGLPLSSDWQRVNSYAVNTSLSQSAAIVLPVSVGRGNLLRWDIRRLAPLEADFVRISKLLLEVIPRDPFFYENATATIAEVVEVKYGLIDTPDGQRWVPWDDIPTGGFYHDTKFFTESVAGDAVKSARQLALHLGQDERKWVAALAGNPYPIVSDRYLMEVLLTTTGIGKFYDFVGIAGKTRDEILVTLGASQKVSGKLNALTGWAFVQSQVTGKWRVALWFQGATGPTFATLDFADDQTSSAENPFYQLLATLDGFLGDTPIHVAEEIISLRPNGAMLGYLIDPKTGELVDSVPEKIAVDHNIPSPSERGGSGSALLIANTGCIICHGPNGGYQPLDTVLAPAKLKRLNIFDDFKDRNNLEAVDRLGAVFGKGGDKLVTFRALTRAREDHATFVFKSTLGWKTEEFADVFKEQFYSWRYDLVTQEQALLELGYRLGEDEDADALFLQVLPDAEVTEATGVAYEDRTIGFLKSGIPVQRHAWNEVFAHAMVRRQELEKEKEDDQ